MNDRTVRSLLVALALGAIGIVAPAATRQAGEPKGAKDAKTRPVLAGRAGDYETSIVYLSGGKPMGPATKGHAKVSSILDDHFVQIDETGEMMGQKFTALRLFGFNAEAGRHEGTWVYTASTAMMRLTGTKQEGETVTFDAEFDRAAGASMRVRITVKPGDANHFTIEIASDSMTEEVAYAKK